MELFLNGMDWLPYFAVYKMHFFLSIIGFVWKRVLYIVTLTFLSITL